MSLKFDLSDFQRVARQIGAFADQIPFALARSLNDAAEVARREIIDTTWAQHITVRNPRFLEAALTSRGRRATKRNLSVEIYDRLGRGSLQLHARGGTKHPRGSSLAIPNKTNLQPRRGGHGVPKGLRPRNLPADKTFVKQSKFGPVIFQRVGSYQKAGPLKKNGERRPAQDNRRLKAMYGLAPSSPVRADVPFYSDFERTMRREVPRAFSRNLQAAMRTAFKR